MRSRTGPRCASIENVLIWLSSAACSYFEPDEDLQRPQPQEEHREDDERDRGEDRDAQGHPRREEVGLLDPRVAREEAAGAVAGASQRRGSSRRARAAAARAQDEADERVDGPDQEQVQRDRLEERAPENRARGRGVAERRLAARNGRRARRAASSSLITSSSSSSGGAPRSAASSSRSASSSASSAEPHLAARAVGAQLAPVAPQREVVAVRAVAGEAALEVAVGALGQLGGQRLGGLRARARPVARARPLPRARARPRGSAKRPARRVDDLGAVAHQRDAVARERRVPRRQRAAAGAAGADRGDQRVALGERGGVLAPRGGAAGHSAATTWSMCARRSAGAPSTSSSRSGRKTATSGRASQSVSRSTGAPSARSRFGSPGWKPTLTAWPRRSSSASSSSRVSDAPKRTTSRSFAVRHERPVQREVQRLEQVRLAGAVAARDHRQRRARAAARPPRTSGSPGR